MKNKNIPSNCYQNLQSLSKHRYVLVFLIFIVILLFLTYPIFFPNTRYILRSLQTIYQSQNSTIENDKLIPLLNWTLHTNHKYNYQFRYPHNIFPYSEVNNLSVQYWTNKVQTKPPLTGNDKDRLILIMEVSSQENMEDILVEFYKDSIELETNIKSERLAITKWSSIVTNGIRGALYLKGMPNGQGMVAPHSYSAVWYREGKFYKLSLSAISREKLIDQKQLFYQIISTFQFLK